MRSTKFEAISLFAIVAWLCLFAAFDEPAKTASVTGTIRSIDATSQTLRLLTGCGHALRLLDIHWTSQTSVRSGGKPAKPFELRVGTIVRAQCRQEADSFVADTIEAVNPGGGS